MGVELGLEDCLQVRSGQQEGFLGVKTLASVFRPEPATHIWVDIHRTQVNVFASVVSPHLDRKPVASPAFA